MHRPPGINSVRIFMQAREIQANATSHHPVRVARALNTGRLWQP
jgi:hypothetical protein